MGTDQNFETSNSLWDITMRVFPRSKLHDVWRTLGVNFSRHVWLKLQQYKGSILPQFLTACCQIWQVHKIIAEDVNRPGEF